MSDNNYSMKDVYETVGEGSLRKAVDCFKKNFSDDEEFIKWWKDSNNQGLDYKSPDEFCKQGEEGSKEREKGKKYLEDVLNYGFDSRGG